MFLTNLYYSVLEEAPMGHAGVEDRVAPLDAYPAYAPLAWHARMIAHLFRGEDAKADEARRRRDLATLGRSDVDMHLELGFLFEGAVYELLDDLLGIKRVLSMFEERARTSPGWVSYRELYLGDYHHLRGERDKAILHFANALECLRGEERYAAHVHVCVRYALALLEYEKPELAHEIALEGVGLVERQKVPAGSRASIHLALAFAEAALGKRDEALVRADTVIGAIERSGTVGIVLVHHLATRARIALKLSDRPTFDSLVAKIAKLCLAANGTSLSSKHARLLREGSLASRFEAVAAGSSRLGPGEVSHTTLASDLKTRFERCRGSGERANLTLRVLIDAAAANLGFLYLFREGGLQLAATTPGELPPPSLEAEVQDWLGDLQHETTAKTRAVPQDLLQALGDSLFEAGDATDRDAMSTQVSAER
jgi:tetratricopeptide (TPR) repeat protein